jgi:uncharacterized SAM-binding protein YcdF (DUF218 family)
MTSLESSPIGRLCYLLFKHLKNNSLASTPVPRKRRIALGASILLVALISVWFMWGPWPDPKPSPLPWRPDAILILGGGDAARVRQGKLLADQYPDVPVLVTGDGGDIMTALEEQGLPASRMIHEQDAESTMDNALLTDPLFQRMEARRVAMVTNWFHVPRALAVFRKEQPMREFAASFEARKIPSNKYDRGCQRRERFAAVLYLLRYGVWSW